MFVIGPDWTLLLASNPPGIDRGVRDLVRVVERLAGAEVRMIGLGALGYDAQPQYNRQTAKKLRKVGMDILSCAPEKLADCMGQIIRG